MSAETLEQLEHYLAYMRELGFRGLALERNPFQAAKPQPAAAAPPRPAAPRAKPAAAPQPKDKGKKKEIPNLFSIMDMMDAATPAEDTRRKAEAVSGADPEEILRNLYQAFHNCEACALSTTRREFVFGEGPPTADLMFVGEGPGQEEDRTGRPFVGDAGQLLTRIIQSMGFQRHEVFIANVVKCRPPRNRTPLPDEIASCSPLLVKQIETVAPKIIIALGASALRFFKGEAASIMRSRGRFFNWREYTVMPTFHPAYILRNPRAKRDVWEDVKQVMLKLGRKPPG